MDGGASIPPQSSQPGSTRFPLSLIHIYLYMDGARLGYGLCDEGNDLDLPAIASLCDAFYIGGTKVGALFGEADVYKRQT